MRTSYRIPFFVLLVVALAVPVSAAQAAITNPVLDFGVSYAKEDGRLANDLTSTAGDTLTIVGKVVQFNDPFADLDPNDPAVEYTYIMTDLVSQGSVVNGPYWLTNYSGGFFAVYCDSTPDADFADMTTFTDGTLILQGTFTGFHTNVRTSGICSGNQNADFQFTGGTLFDRVSDVNNVGYLGTNTGAFTVCATIPPTQQQQQGYFAASDTKLDVIAPVPTERKSWGSIKSKYD
jgi:hypothetical protein